MTKCIKRQINYSPKINILKPLKTKKVDERKEKRMEMGKCIKQMIICAHKINILVLNDTKMKEETKKRREMTKVH